MKRKYGNFVIVGFFLSLSNLACDSPVMNHTDPATPTAPTRSTNSDRNTVSNKDKEASCPLDFPNHGMCASLSWDQPPQDGKETSIKIRFWKKDSGTENGPYVDPPHLQPKEHDPIGVPTVILWMPSMGHGSSPVSVDHAEDASRTFVPGVFEGTHVYFIMGGDWDVHIQLKVGPKVHEEVIVPIHVN